MSGATTNIDLNSSNGVVAPKLPGGATLPFPPTPSASIAGRTMQESVYHQRVTPQRLPDDAPNILIVLIDDAGPGSADAVRWRGAHRRRGRIPRRASTTASTQRRCVRRPGRHC